MRTSLPIENADHAADFIYVTVKELWPEAVVLDATADQRQCRMGFAPGSPYGFDVFRSDADVQALFTGDVADPPHVNVCVGAHTIDVSGDAQVVQHIASHPLWASR